MNRLREALSAVAAVLILSAFGIASSPAQAPATPPSQAPVQAQPLPPPSPGQPASPPSTEAPPPVAQPPATDAFGEEVILTAKTIVFMNGNATWDTAFETLVDSFKSVYIFLDRQGIKPAGPPMTVYTSTDDTGFQYQAAVPIGEEPANPPRGDIALGKSPGGKMLKFVHRGSYDSMDTTYEAITNYLDSKQLEAEDLFLEEYVTDPLKTPEDKLVINVFVPVKGGT